MIFTRSIGPARIPQGPYVLLVDDEMQSVEPLGELVRYSGFASVATGSATDALACCLHRKPSVVVTDLVMPRFDGRALARKVRRRHPSMPIVLVTGQNLEDPEWVVPSDLFDAIFPKPLELEKFLTTLASLMARRCSSTRPGADLDPTGDPL